MDDRLLADTRSALDKGVEKGYYDFIALHQRIFGTPYQKECKCKGGGKLFNIITNWYNNETSKNTSING